MKVDSLHIGLPREEMFGARKYLTSICKKPAEGPLRLSPDGFQNDGPADLKNHGGPDKAVCVYCTEHYAEWNRELDKDLPQAAFGENLTVSGFDEDDVCIGDIIRVGSAICQVSQPRQPCRTLAARMGVADMLKRVADSGRTGFYLRILDAGEVRAGDELVLERRDPGGITISYANQVYYHERKNREAIMRILAVKALSGSWREALEKMLAKTAG
jgi:MOSC domain-containing protein YiiM